MTWWRSAARAAVVSRFVTLAVVVVICATVLAALYMRLECS